MLDFFQSERYERLWMAWNTMHSWSGRHNYNKLIETLLQSRWTLFKFNSSKNAWFRGHTLNFKFFQHVSKDYKLEIMWKLDYVLLILTQWPLIILLWECVYLFLFPNPLLNIDVRMTPFFSLLSQIQSSSKFCQLFLQNLCRVWWLLTP